MIIGTNAMRCGEGLAYGAPADDTRAKAERAKAEPAADAAAGPFGLPPAYLNMMFGELAPLPESAADDRCAHAPSVKAE